MKVIGLKNFCMGVSTPRVVDSIKAIMEHMVEMIRWSSRIDTEVQRIKEEV